MTIREICLSGCAFAALMGAGPALAQTNPPPPAGEEREGAYVIEELVVTAQRHEADLESEPLAVTTFNAEQRNLIGANNTRQMIDLTPGVFVTDFGINMRGIGRQNATTALGTDNGVAYYVNGFYNVDFNVIGESTLFGGNVQFLRGPQGTLYGRDAIGGASNLISRRPTREFMGETVLSYGSYEATNIGGTVSGPITDRYRYRFGAQNFNQAKPTQENRGPTEAGFTSDNYYFEFQLEGEPTEASHFLLRSTTFSYLNTPAYTAPERYNANVAAQGALVPNPQAGIVGNPPQEPRVIDVDTRGADRLTGNQVHILNADYDLGKATLYYVGGYARYKSKGYSDFDNTSRASYTTAAGLFIPTRQVANYLNRNQYFSHELRLTGNAVSPLEWTLGLYYLKTNYNERYWQAMPDVAALDQPTLNGVATAPNPDRAFYSQRNIVRQQSAAVFGQATWHFDEQLRATAGLRYTDDSKRATTNFRYVFYNPAFGPLSFESTPQALVGDIQPGPSAAGLLLKIHDTGYTGRLGLEFEPTPDTLIYANYGRGYKAGGFTLGDATANNTTKPEHLNAWEAGVKHDFAPTLQTDATVFYYDYRDMQVPVTAQNNATGGTFAAYTNAAKAVMYGIELQGTWTPVPQASITANYSYLNAEFTDFCCAVDFVRTPSNPAQPATPNRPALPAGSPIAERLDGNRIPRAPEHKASISGYYAFEFEPGSLIIGGSVAYTSEIYSTVFTRDIYRIDPYTVANAVVTWRAANNQYEVVGQVSNIFENDYTTGIGVAGPNLGFARTEFLGPPQTWSILLRTRF